MVEFKIQRSDNGDAAVVTLSGELDVDSGAPLHEALVLLCSRGQPVLMDVSELTKLDRYGLSVIVQAARQLREQRCPLAVVSPQPEVRRVFHASGVDDIIPICRSLDEALALTTVLRTHYGEVHPSP